MNNGTSLAEYVIFWYAQKHWNDAVYRAKPYDFELDIWLPQLDTAIEFDGKHWHAEKLEADNAKDALCVEHGIRLIRVRDYSLPDTQSAEIVRHDEISWYEEREVIEEIFEILGVSDYDVDIERDADAIQEAYALASKNSILALTSYLDHVAFDSITDVDEGYYFPLMQEDSIVSDQYGDMRLYWRNKYLNVFTTWRNNKRIIVCDDGFLAFADSIDNGDLFDMSVDILRYLPYSSMFVSFSVESSAGAFIRSRVYPEYDVVEFVAVFCSLGVEDDGLSYLSRHPIVLRIPLSGDYTIEHALLICSSISDKNGFLADTFLFLCAALAYMRKSLESSSVMYTDKRNRKISRSSKRDGTTVRLLRDVVVRKYVRSDTVSKESLGGHHASPRRHIRRAHWQRYLCGSGDNKHYEYRFIEEIVVMPNAADVTSVAITQTNGGD